jgi:thiol-disulfide isomerase/thioredoxin
VEVVYRTTGGLAGESQLHLRARLRTSEGGSYNNGLGSSTLAALHRDEDGSYLGTFSLPEDVVYAALAVEDLRGESVETPRAGFWELIVHDDAGVPLSESLHQRFNDHMGRDLLVVLETARELTRAHPDQPSSWSSLQAAEGWVFGGEGAEEREAKHRARFLEFEQDFEDRSDLNADEVAYMYWYASGEAREPWKARLLEEYPGHFFAVQATVMDLYTQSAEDPTALLSELEKLWNSADDDEARSRILSPALGAARTAGPTALRTWTGRWLAMDPTRGVSVALTLTTNEATRDEGIDILENEIEAALAMRDETRDLGSTREEQEKDVTLRVAALRRSLGEALVDAGRVEEGISTLGKAAAVGWDSGRFRSLGEALLTSGDQDGALRNFAFVAADPGGSEASIDSLRNSVGIGAGEWEAAVASARQEMGRRTLSEATERSLPEARLTARGGEDVVIHDLFGSEATVVVFWSRYCGYSHQAMPRIVALAADLEAEGIPLLAVTSDGAEDVETYLRDGEWDLEVLLDTQSEAARSFNSWGTPEYYVVDREGRLRFVSSLESIRRQLEALASEVGGS